MRIIDNLNEMTEIARGWLAAGTVGFVSITCVHPGTQVLINTARTESQILVVSIIDKALLFAIQQPATLQPRDLMQDIQLLDRSNIDVIFMPRVQDLYPEHFSTYITPAGPLAAHVEGINHAGYARIYATTMTKLFQLVRPDIAFFGQKDALQIGIIRQIVHDLSIDMKLRILPTVRESDGLALSQRNRDLSPAERQAAPIIHRTLLKAKEHIDDGEREVTAIQQFIAQQFANAPLVELEQVIICDARTLAPVTLIAPGTLITITARLGQVHLVDNIEWMDEGQWRI